MPTCEQHVPPSHPPPQQSIGSTHNANVDAWHTSYVHSPPTQLMPEQHCDVLEHAWPRGAHVQTRLWQLPLQQSPSAEQPLLLSVQLHVPARQVRPVQQSDVPPHVVKRGLHRPHAPFRQSSPEQHSDAMPHVAPWSLQLGLHVRLLPSQRNPVQHGVVPQAPSSWLHAEEQRPATHARLSQQSVVCEHVSPSALHCGAPQTPSLQPREQQSLSKSQPAPSARHPRAHTPAMQASRLQHAASV